MISARKILLSILSLFVIPLFAFADIYSGTVIDENGNPLPGATVRSLDTGKTVATDNRGRFSIEVPGKKARLHVSYIGYAEEFFLLNSEKRRAELRLTPDHSTLEEVVVTATRTPKTLKDVPVVTRLISAEDIRKTDATNIQDMLVEELPGLEFTYTMSQETSLNMNGFGGKSVLFLVDGERLAGETLDNIDFNRLNLDNVGKIEVVKGAASALYGANAVGGVVNLITRESTEPWKVKISSRYKTLGDEWRTGGDINFHNGKWTSNTNFQNTTARTVKLTDAFDTESNLQNLFGGSTYNIKERLSFQASDKLRLVARGGYFNRISTRINYDDHYVDYNGGLRCNWNLHPEQNLELSYSYDRYDKARYVSGNRTHDHDYSNRQHIVHALYNYFIGKHVLTAGTDYMHDYLTTYQFSDNNVHCQSTVDAYVQFDYNPLTLLNVIASVREDYFSESKNNSVTARLAIMLKFNRFSIRANYAGGFRAPTLKEMYMNFDMAGIQMIYGNPYLKPERSHNFNLALEHNGNLRKGIFGGTYSVTGTGYYNLYDRRIITADFPGDEFNEPGAIYCNENGVRVYGLDLSARYKSLMGIGVLFNCNYLHTSGQTVDSQFSQPRPHSMTWRLDYEKRLCSVYKIYAGISGRYLAKHDTDNAYSLWKFTLQQEICRGINLNFSIDNLLNYKPTVYFWNTLPTKGRTWSVGVSLNVDSIIR